MYGMLHVRGISPSWTYDERLERELGQVRVVPGPWTPNTTQCGPSESEEIAYNMCTYV